jgi:predicted ferric reductase
VLVAYLPSIRAFVPNHPYFSLLDGIILWLFVQCLVALSPIFLKNADQWRKVGTFWTVISMNALWVSVVIVLTIIYKFKKSKHDKKYNKESEYA